MKTIQKSCMFILKAGLTLIVLGIIVLFIVIAEICYVADQQIQDSINYYDNNYQNMGNCYVDKSWENKLGNSPLNSSLDHEDCSFYVDKSLEQYPEHLRSYIENEWSIVFTSNTPSFALEYMTNIDVSNCCAVTVSNIKTIFVYACSAESMPYILTHEFAHALAYEFGCIDYDPEFYSLYLLHIGTFKEDSPYAVPGYATSSVFEFFATTMSTYVTDPEWMEEKAPDVVEYMESVLNAVPYEGTADELLVRLEGMRRVKQNIRS